MKKLTLAVAVSALMVGCQTTSTDTQASSATNKVNSNLNEVHAALKGELYLVIPGVHSASADHFKSIFEPKLVKSENYLGMNTTDKVLIDHGIGKDINVGKSIKHSLSTDTYKFLRERCIVKLNYFANGYECTEPKTLTERYQLTANTKVYSKQNRTVMKLSGFHQDSTSHSDFNTLYKHFTPSTLPETFNEYELVREVQSPYSVESTKTAVYRGIERLDDFTETIKVNGKNMPIKLGIQSYKNGSLITYKVRLPAVRENNVVYYNKDYTDVVDYIETLHQL